MKQDDLRYFREHLLLRRTELLGEAERTAQGMGDEIDGFPDPTDRGSLESERNLVLRIRDRERKLLSKIDEALGRIDDGSFGLCEECGEPIGIERLKARPVTTLCIECKADQEERERLSPR
ncbi:MAG TPA: RNA polymerase-binding protein DksA [Candidatus Binatia bacterium]|nr:RNA polymerase-binding protein DksA [Candidatus Binatia bacterium]